MNKFENRFAGTDNAGLRAKISEAVSGTETGEDAATAVLSVGGIVALTAAGQHTLAQVAEDYRTAR